MHEKRRQPAGLRIILRQVLTTFNANPYVVLFDRYLIREISLSSVAVAMALIAIFLAYSMTQFLTDAASGLLKAAEVAHLTFFKSLIALEVLLPLALYFGLIVGLGRLNNDTEITAMHACGCSRRRLHRPLILLSLLLAAAVGSLSIVVRPWAYDAMYRLRAEADAASELGRIRSRRFYLFEEENRAIYVENIGKDGMELTGVFIRNRKADDLEVISSNTGRLETFVTDTLHRLVLNDASIYKSTADAADFYGTFDSLTIFLNAERKIPRDYRAKAETTPALYLSAQAYDRAELQWRLSTPLSTILLALAALRLVDSKPRAGRFARVPVAIGVYAVYYNLLGVGRTWVEHGTLPNIWWVPALLACTVAAMSVRPLPGGRR
jgi:lipopolysaccharide export system permease protein